MELLSAGDELGTGFRVPKSIECRFQTLVVALVFINSISHTMHYVIIEYDISGSGPVRAANNSSVIRGEVR